MQNMKIVTFNMRCPWDTDGINSFMHRAGLIYDKINKEKPDIIGFQECTPKNMEVMEKLFPEYTFHGTYRSENYWGEGVFTAVRKELYRVVACEIFWISPTPYVPGSRFPSQSDCPRICNVAEIRRREDNKMIRLFNIHLDHISEEARVDGMKCVLSKMAEYSARLPMPTVILGDFNTEPGSIPVEMCHGHGAPALFDVTADIAITNHDFGRLLETSPSKIDYILASAELAESYVKTEAWDDEHHGIYLSDHYPVCAEFGC